MTLYNIPKTLTVGADVDFTWSHSEYTATDYTCTCIISNASYRYTITGTQDGDAWVLQSSTGTWIAGKYSYVMVLTDSTSTIVPEQGTVEILPGFASATDRRSHARKVLDAIEDLLEGRASKDVYTYSIAGRSLTRMSVTELLKWRDRYKMEVAQEDAAERLVRGENVPNSTIRIRFT